MDFGVYASDVVANVLGYVPVGIVLGELGVLRAVITAALMSAFAESTQLVMLHRTSSAIDLATNVTGAFLGAIVSAHWRIRSPIFGVNTWRALAAAALAFSLILLVWPLRVPPPLRGERHPRGPWKPIGSSTKLAVESRLIPPVTA